MGKANAKFCFDDPDKTNILTHVENMEEHVKKNEKKLFDADLDLIIKDALTMAIAVELCTTKDDECKKQLSVLEKQLDKQLKARADGDAWHKEHLANATALVNLHIQTDILGDVKSADANKHMKGDVCQMQMVEYVWSIHDFVEADNRFCVKGLLADLKANAKFCFDDPDKTNILTHVENMEEHVKKNEKKLFDADLDLIIKDALTMAIATHESENVPPAKVDPKKIGGLRINSERATIQLGSDIRLSREGKGLLSISADHIKMKTMHLDALKVEVGGETLKDVVESYMQSYMQSYMEKYMEKYMAKHIADFLKSNDLKDMKNYTVPQ